MNQPSELKIAWCAAALTSTHFSVRTAMPLLLSALAAAHRLSDSQLGDIGACYSIGATLIALSAPFWLRWSPLRAATTVFLLIGGSALAAAINCQSVAALMTVFTLSGLGFGGVYTLMIALLAQSSNPSRAFAWQWGLGSAPGVLLLPVMPLLARPGGDKVPLFVLLLATNALVALTAALLPKRASLTPPRAAVQRGATDTHRHLPVVLALGAVMGAYLGITGAWSFLDRVALQAGLTPQYSGTVLAIAVATSSVVALVTGEWGRIGARRVPMTLAFISVLAGLFLISYWPTPVGFAVGATLFVTLATFVLTFSLSLVARLDITGHAAALPAAVLGMGSIVGPAMAGHVYQALGVHHMMISCALSLMLAWVAYMSAYPTR